MPTHTDAPGAWSSGVGRRMRILWLKSGPLHPLDSGGKLRTYNMLRAMARQHTVTFLGLLPDGTPPAVREAAREYSATQRWIPWQEPGKRSARFLLDLARNFLFSRRPYIIDKYYSPALCEAIREEARPGRYDVVVCDFPAPSLNLLRAGVLGGPWASKSAATADSPSTGLGTLSLSKGRPPTDRLGSAPGMPPVVLFQHNVEAMIWKRMAETKTSPVVRAYFRGQWRRMERYEQRLCAACAGIIGVSADDCRVMREQYGLGNVLGDVPTGVDVEYFAEGAAGTEDAGRQAKPAEGGAPTSVAADTSLPVCSAPAPAIDNAARTPALLFLGSMDWMPNIDAVVWFAREIFAPIQAAVPGVTLTIVGRTPTPAVRQLAAANPAITVTGTVPDVRPYLRQAAVCVVPLRAGGGTRIKIFEAMAAGLPVVSTRIGAEGLPVNDREHLLLADRPAEFAGAVVELLRQPELRRRLADNGRELVRTRFSWEQAAARFTELCAPLTSAVGH